jgi:vacuolar-type H+-ATPase subunit E/Vma4
MAIINQHSPDALCAEILAQARRQRDEILGSANTEAAAIRDTARTEAAAIRRERHDQAQTEAARRKDLILATVAVETARLRAGRVEAILESIHAEIRRRLLADHAADHETIVALAADAISHMPGNRFALDISAADHAACGNGLAGEIARRAGRALLDLTISADGSVPGGGVTIGDAAGREFWDNRLLARLERFWPALRRQIALQASLVEEDSSTGGAS